MLCQEMLPIVAGGRGNADWDSSVRGRGRGSPQRCGLDYPCSAACWPALRCRGAGGGREHGIASIPEGSLAGDRYPGARGRVHIALGRAIQAGATATTPRGARRAFKRNPRQQRALTETRASFRSTKLYFRRYPTGTSGSGTRPSAAPPPELTTVLFTVAQQLLASPHSKQH